MDLGPVSIEAVLAGANGTLMFGASIIATYGTIPLNSKQPLKLHITNTRSIAFRAQARSGTLYFFATDTT